jgi:HEPN domain-containing protein
MQDRLDHTRGWLLKAESDLVTAKKVLEGDGPYDTACFHAQQAAEKYLKGLLALHLVPVPRTHDLDELDELCRATVSGWKLADVDLTELTPYAVELRYDFEFWPDRETAVHAIEQAQRVRSVVLAALPEAARP